MSIIDNQTQTMLEALRNALSTSDRVDIQVGYFYFSGFELLAEELKDKKVRILVGKQIDPNAVPKIIAMQQKTGKPVDLDRFQPQESHSSRSAQKADYFEGFTRLFNETSVFDEPRSQDAYKIFEQKIIDGSLEIKLTNTDEHGKMYLVHNKSETNQGGDAPGTLFIGSSNLTYNGLLDQGELNSVNREKSQFLEGLQKFEAMWSDSDNIDVATIDNQSEFKDVIRKLWINAVERPYLMYIRVLHELFGQDKDTEIKTPSKITGESFIDLEYQLDAIKMGINKIEQYGGVIIADVVGLGKSIIASTIAYNIAHKDNINVIIICPPHLISQWEDYQANFHLPGTKIFSSGKIDDAYNWCFNQQSGPSIIVIDEAHRYRNELTDDYMLLHQLVRSNRDNKVVVLTATPFNNDPKDVFALVKLFQTPGQSTIKSVDNLSIRFRELIQRYKELRNAMRGNKLSEEEVEVEAKDISRELKRLIEPIIIRRSRLDLKRISRYRNNLIKQGIEFAEIDGPTLLEYDLEDLFGLYVTTLEKITDEEKGFIGARYKPVTYLSEESREEFIKKYGNQIDVDLVTAQTNLAKFMKRLLVMRFESSKQAFGITLQNMIDSNLFISKWYNEKGQIPVLKKGRIPDPDSYEIDTDDDLSEELTDQLEDQPTSKHKLIFVDRNWISPSFIKEVEADTQLLQKIKSDWFEDPRVKDFDPKLDNLTEKIKDLLGENPDKKIIIFSAYADTVDYVGEHLKKRGFSRTFKYTAADASRSYREELKQNFDAGIKDELQKNDYDILVATDALSEGYNLHRAGIIFNYDIPFNPTRVIQRIGRINRINKKVFDRLHIYNFFPTSIGEDVTRVKQISMLKMSLINSVVGSDTKTLTDTEELKTFQEDKDVEKLLKAQLKQATDEAEEESWDAKHREAYDQTPDEIIEKAKSVRPRSRVIRKGQQEEIAIAYGKRGDHSVFAIKHDTEDPLIVSAEQVLPFFVAKEDEEGYAPDSEYNKLFVTVRDKLFEKSKLPKIQGNRAEAIQRLTVLSENLPLAKDYALDLIKVIKEYDDLSDGQYKDIARVKLDNLEEAYKKIQEIAPVQVIKVSLNKADQLQGQAELIVLSQELKV